MFPTTRWDDVLTAQDEGADSSCNALSRLCETYWMPVYLYIRARGHRKEDAEDLCQQFFATLLEKNYLKYVRQERGKFRTFLRLSVRNFLANERNKAQARKRGGGVSFVSLDSGTAELLFGHLLDDGARPDRLFDHGWASTVLDSALSRLRATYAEKVKAELFELLEFALTGEKPAPSYSELAARLSVKVSYIKVAVHRLRREYAALIKEEVSQTLSPGEDLDAEIKHILEAASPG